MIKLSLKPVFLSLIGVLMIFVTSISAAGKKEPLFLHGEKITYVIKKFGVKAGEATLVFHGLTKTRGYDAYLVIFTANALNFFDEEKIYVDPVTFYPIRIERALNLFGKREKITEDYFAQKGSVKITKEAGGEVTQKVIDKKTRLDNIYCFLYRYRFLGTFRSKDSFTMHLPTQEVTFELKKTVKVKTAGKTYDSYYMKSDPARYEVWFDAGPKKIPLKINGAVGFGDTTMMMAKYEGYQKR